MSKRGVAFLLILCLTIAVGTLVQDYRLDAAAARERAAGGMLDLAVRDLGAELAAMQSAQRAYVAKGQNPADWLSSVAKSMDDLSAGIARRRAVASDADSRGFYDAATEVLGRFRKLDTQIRAGLGDGDGLRASDMIFVDSAAAVQKVNEALASAQARDRAAIDRNLSNLVMLRWAMNGVALLFVLGVALYFGRAVTQTSGRGAPTTAQMLRDLPPPVKTASAPGPVVLHGNLAAHAPSAQPAVQLTRPPANLAAAAELCVDLGRVLDAGDVPALLERAAIVLDAKGIVLWAIGADGARLHPSICHGYPDKVLRKLRPLQIDDDNVTSIAFRSLQPQAVNGAAASDAAAIAIPLVTGTGCVGVLAAELRHNRPHADLIPIARILGAQFSTLVASPEDAGLRSAQG